MVVVLNIHGLASLRRAFIFSSTRATDESRREYAELLRWGFSKFLCIFASALTARALSSRVGCTFGVGWLYDVATLREDQTFCLCWGCLSAGGLCFGWIGSCLSAVCFFFLFRFLFLFLCFLTMVRDVCWVDSTSSNSVAVNLKSMFLNTSCEILRFLGWSLRK